MEHSIVVDVNRIKLFPTLIYSYKSEISVEQNQIMLDAIEGNLKVNYKDIRSGKDVPFGLFQGRDDLHTLSSFKSLADFAEHLCGGILNEEGYKNQKIEITQMWANKQVDSSVHPPHTHANSILSGIYYLKTTDNTSGTQFFDPRAQAKVMIPRRDNQNMLNSHMYQINSETGHGVIFPSWLQHWVPSNTDERISISWNVIVRGDYGEPQTLQNARI